jgi:hypothetical protein
LGFCTPGSAAVTEAAPKAVAIATAIAAIRLIFMVLLLS